jgi:hypothetical protein
MSENGTNAALARGVAAIDSATLSDRDRERAERMTLAIKAKQTPKGLLGLPAHLDDRRLEYGITDAAFEIEASYDRILVFQVATQKGDRYDGGLIHLTEKKQAEEIYRAPLGIIVSAGLGALDSLYSHGMQLGDKVIVVKNAPYFVRYDIIEGKEYSLMVLTDGEIVGNYDVARRLKERKLFRVQNPDAPANRVEHVFMDENKKFLLPEAAWRSED